MKINWIITSIIAGIVTGLISFYLSGNIKLSLIAGIAATVIVILNNPKRRYMKAFWVVLSLIMILNGFFFEVVGKWNDVDYKFGQDDIGDSVTIFLIILGGVLVFLDYLERNGKLNSSLFSFSSFKIGGNATIYKDINIKNGDFNADKKQQIEDNQ